MKSFQVSKKNQITILLILSLSISVISHLFLLSEFNGKGNNVEFFRGKIEISKSAHERIWIKGDSEFTAENGVKSGSGTKTDPYIITGWIINANKSGDCIHIEDTTKYFVIENCELFNASTYCNGISIHNCSNAKISKNLIYSNGNGIELYYHCRNHEISDNTIYNNTKNVISNQKMSRNQQCSDKINDCCS